MVGRGGGVSGPLLRRDARDHGGDLPPACSTRLETLPFEPTQHGLVYAGVLLQGAIRGHGAAKCAVDIALHDLVGKVLDLPVHVVRQLPADIPPTDFTIGIDEPAVVAERARRAADFPALKIKCGGPADLATLRAVRDVFGGPIRVDANTGWTRATAEQLLPALVDLGVELIEQPFPARAYEDLAWLQELLADADRGRRELRLSRGPATRSWASSPV